VANLWVLKKLFSVLNLATQKFQRVQREQFLKLGLNEEDGC